MATIAVYKSHIHNSFMLSLNFRKFVRFLLDFFHIHFLYGSNFLISICLILNFIVQRLCTMCKTVDYTKKVIVFCLPLLGIHTYLSIHITKHMSVKYMHRIRLYSTQQKKTRNKSESGPILKGPYMFFYQIYM